MRKLQKEVANWQKKTFGRNRAHVSGMLQHLLKEVFEIKDAMTDLDTHTRTPDKYLEKVESELADCIILLVGLADAYGVDLESAVKAKMKINKQRKWKQPDNEGVIEHEDN